MLTFSISKSNENKMMEKMSGRIFFKPLKRNFVIFPGFMEKSNFSLQTNFILRSLSNGVEECPKSISPLNYKNIIIFSMLLMTRLLTFKYMECLVIQKDMGGVLDARLI